MNVTGGSTDVTTYFVLRLAATGVEATGLTIANMDLQYTRSGVAPTAKVDATALAATDTAHTDNYGIEVDATDQPGLYRIDWPDAAFAAGVKEVLLTVKVATCFTEHMAVEIDPPVNVTKLLGTAWLPPGTAGTPDVNAKLIGATAQTGRDLGTSVLLSSGTGTGQLDFTSGVVKANLWQYIGTAFGGTAAQIVAAFQKFFDKATPTGTINSLPDAVAGAPGGVFIAGANAATSITTALTANIIGNITGTLATVTAVTNAVAANLTQILGTALTETAGLLAGAFKKFFNVAAPTATCLSLPDAVPGANGGLPTTNGTKVSQTVDLTAGQTILTKDVLLSGTASAGSTTTITLTGGVATTGLYNGCLVAITAGTGAGQSRTILSYVGGTTIATVTRNWVTSPANDSVFVVLAADVPALLDSGTAQAGAAGTITLHAGASGIDDTYNDNVIFISAGTGMGQSRQITDYDQASKVANITPLWTTTPDNTSVYQIIAGGRVDIGRWLGVVPLALSAQQVQAVVPAATVVASVTGNVGGNVNGSVGSVAGNVTGSVGSVAGNVVGSVGSVVGAVGSVAGNVVGSVGSVVAPVLITASQLFIKRATALTITFPMNDSFWHVPATLLVVTARRSIDGGALGGSTNAVAEVGSGLYSLVLSVADLNGACITFEFTAPGADTRHLTVITQA